MPNRSTSMLEHQLAMIMPSAITPGRPCDLAYSSSVWMLEPTWASSPLAADSMALSYHSIRSAVTTRTGPLISAPTSSCRAPASVMAALLLPGVVEQGLVGIGRDQWPVGRPPLEVVVVVGAAPLHVFVGDAAADDEPLADIGGTMVPGMVLVVDAGVRSLGAADPLLLQAVLLEDAHLVDVDHGRRADLAASRRAGGMEPLAVLLDAVRILARHEGRDHVVDRLEHVAGFEIADVPSQHARSSSCNVSTRDKRPPGCQAGWRPGMAKDLNGRLGGLCSAPSGAMPF